MGEIILIGAETIMGEAKRKKQARHDAAMMQMVEMAAHVAHNVFGVMPGAPPFEIWEAMSEESRDEAVNQVLLEMELMASGAEVDGQGANILRAVISGMMAPKDKVDA